MLLSFWQKKEKTIGCPGQIRKFDNQIHFNFIQIRQILSCRENYHSYSFGYHSINFSLKESVFMSFNLKSALRAFKFATARQGVYKLNDQIAKIVQFSWFGMKNVYFRMIQNIWFES